MKKITLLLILLLSFNLNGQSPNAIPYQGVARNASGAILANQPIMLRMSIHDLTATGTVVFKETHSVITSSLGQFSRTIGLGTPITGTFASVDWGNGAKFLQVELSTNAGTSYLDMGTTQFMSVPYALYAENVSANSVATAISSINNEGVGKIMVLYTSGYAYGFSQNSIGTGSWSLTGISGNIIGAKAAKDMIVLYTNSMAYGFSQSGTNSGTWTSQSLTGSPLGIVASGTQIVVYTPNAAYGFAKKSTLTAGSWTSQNLTGQTTNIGYTSTNQSIMLYDNSYVYSFYQNSSETAIWSIQPISGIPVGAINGK